MTGAKIEVALKRAEELKLFPAAAARVRSVADSPESSLLDLEEAVSLDPTLSAQILKVANSPFFGLRREVGTVQRALFVLGFDATRDMAMALTMMALARSERPGRRALWSHALRVGAAAQQLGMHVDEIDPREAFVTGLVHDLGVLILLEIDEERYLGLLADGDLSEGDRLEKERETFGFDHADLGGACLSRWNLPKGMCAAIRHHHSPENREGQVIPEAALLWTADHLVHEIDDTGDMEEICEQLAAEEISSSVGLDAQTLAHVATHLDETTSSLGVLG